MTDEYLRTLTETASADLPVELHNAYAEGDWSLLIRFAKIVGEKYNFFKLRPSLVFVIRLPDQWFALGNWKDRDDANARRILIPNNTGQAKCSGLVIKAADEMYANVHKVKIPSPIRVGDIVMYLKLAPKPVHFGDTEACKVRQEDIEAIFNREE